MSPADDLLSQALALPIDDRLHIANELLASVKPPGIMSVDDPSFDDMLERRRQELRDGTVKPISAEESIESIRRSLAERRRS